MQLDFEALEPGLAGERAAQVLAHQLFIVGMHELGQCPAFEPVPVAAADERSEPVVGEDDVLAMHGQRFVQAAEQADQRALALADHQVLHRHLLEQAVGVVREPAGGPASAHTLRESAIAHDAVELIRGARQRGSAALAPDEHAEQHQNRESQSTSQSP